MPHIVIEYLAMASHIFLTDSPVQEDLILEESSPPAEELNGGEVLNPPENGDVPVEEEEEPVAEVVNEPQEVSQMVVETNTKIEEVPKKSYAKIVSDHWLASYIFFHLFWQFSCRD